MRTDRLAASSAERTERMPPEVIDVAVGEDDGGDRPLAQVAPHQVEGSRRRLPKKKMKVTAGELRGEIAILDVEGESPAGLRALYLVRMVNEDGSWRFDQARMAGLL